MVAASEGPDGAQRNRILTVCSANVCRSPVAAFRLSSMLGPVPAAEVVSAGLEADDGGAICAVAAASIAEAPGAADYCAGHRSHRIDEALIAGSGLVLTATMRQRAVIVTLLPSARTRSFTLREAAALLRAEPSELEALALQDSAVPWAVRVARLLDGRRGTVAPQPIQRHRFRRVPELHDWDIGDAHSQKPPAHRKAVDATAEVATQIGMRLSELTALSVR